MIDPGLMLIAMWCCALKDPRDHQDSSIKEREEYLREMENFVDDGLEEFKEVFQDMVSKKRITTTHRQLYEQVCGEKFR